MRIVQCASCSVELEVPAGTAIAEDNAIRAGGWSGRSEGYRDEDGREVFSYLCAECAEVWR